MGVCVRVGLFVELGAKCVECGAGVGCSCLAWVGVGVERSVSRSDGLSGTGRHVWACSG